MKEPNVYHNLLIDKLPTSVCIGGKNYKIYSNFRNMILFDGAMNDERLTNEDKINVGLGLFYAEMPANMDKCIDELFKFYRCGREPAAIGGGGTSERLYSFDYDAPLIYAAFRGQYRISLARMKYLHWWEFMALFEGLSEDCRISKIMGIRSIAIDNKMSGEERAFYQRQKEIYAIPKQLKADDIEEFEILQAKSDEFERYASGEIKANG